jgi:hypothetical protein
LDPQDPPPPKIDLGMTVVEDAGVYLKMFRSQRDHFGWKVYRCLFQLAKQTLGYIILD